MVEIVIAGLFIAAMLNWMSDQRLREMKKDPIDHPVVRMAEGNLGCLGVLLWIAIIGTLLAIAGGAVIVPEGIVW